MSGEKTKTRDAPPNILMHFLKTGFRPAWAIAVCFAVLSLLYLVWTWSHVLGELGGDAAYYLLMAEYFSPWSEPSSIASYFAWKNLYPPLYPLLLAFLGGAQSLLAAHLITTGCLLLSFLFLYLWQRELGVSRSISLSCTTIFSIFFGTYIQALAILSEGLYLALTLIALWSVCRSEKTENYCWLWVCAGTIAAATLTRTAGVSLSVAFIVYLIWHRAQRGPLLIATAIIPTILWHAMRPNNGSGYLSALFYSLSVEAVSRMNVALQNNIVTLWRGFASNIGDSAIALWVATPLSVICFAGSLVRAKTGKLDGLYVVIYMAMVLLWPYPWEAQRLIFVIMPILLAQGVLLLAILPSTWRNKNSSSIFLAAVFFAPLVVVALPNLTLTIKRFNEPLPAALEPYRHDTGWYRDNLGSSLDNVRFNYAFVKSLEQLDRQIPADACIYSIKPSIAGLYARRISITPPLTPINDNDFYGHIKTSGCRFFHLVAMKTPTYQIPFYPELRLHNELRILGETRMRWTTGEEQPVIWIAELKNGIDATYKTK